MVCAQPKQDIPVLPYELWSNICANVHDKDLGAFCQTSKMHETIGLEELLDENISAAELQYVAIQHGRDDAIEEFAQYPDSRSQDSISQEVARFGHAGMVKKFLYF